MAQVDWGRINKRTRIICRELREHVMCHCMFQKKLWCCMECPEEKIAEIGGEVQAVEASAGRKTYGRKCRLEPVAGLIRAKVAVDWDQNRTNNKQREWS